MRCCLLSAFLIIAPMILISVFTFSDSILVSSLAIIFMILAIFSVFLIKLPNKAEKIALQKSIHIEELKKEVK